MSQRTYDFFVKRSQFFYPSCATPSLLNADVLPTAPAPAVLPSPPTPPAISPLPSFMAGPGDLVSLASQTSSATFAEATQPVTDSAIPPPLRDVDPQIIEALRREDRAYVLELGQLMESLINDGQGQCTIPLPSADDQCSLVHRCCAYYQLRSEADPLNGIIYIESTSESRIACPMLQLSELVLSVTGFRDDSGLQDDEVPFRGQLRELRGLYRLDESWPPDDLVLLLSSIDKDFADLASLAVRYLRDPFIGDPQFQLHRLLSVFKTAFYDNVQELPRLYDSLCLDILSRIPSDTYNNHVKPILVSQVLPTDFLSDRSLAMTCETLGIAHSRAYGGLRYLHPVMFIPPPRDITHKNITIYDNSFLLFLTDSTRSGDYAIIKGEDNAYTAKDPDKTQSDPSVITSGTTHALKQLEGYDVGDEQIDATVLPSRNVDYETNLSDASRYSASAMEVEEFTTYNEFEMPETSQTISADVYAGCRQRCPEGHTHSPGHRFWRRRASGFSIVEETMQEGQAAPESASLSRSRSPSLPPPTLSTFRQETPPVVSRSKPSFLQPLSSRASSHLPTRPMEFTAPLLVPPLNEPALFLDAQPSPPSDELDVSSLAVPRPISRTPPILQLGTAIPPFPPPPRITRSLAQRPPTPPFEPLRYLDLSEHTGSIDDHKFVIKNPRSNGILFQGSGLDKLREHSMPDAFYNSVARYPPPKCHPGTCQDYITKIMDWALGDSDRQEPILWMCGPFGVGKSAIAQSCAEALQSQNKLAATLFFSRSNADRNNSRRVFTSIVCQVAALCEPFGNIVDARIREDPAIVTKSLPTQFGELLARPLGEVNMTQGGISGRVVIIDGLDEYGGTPQQCEIISVIATSARDRTTPLRWFITSRPEDPIIRTMTSVNVSAVSSHLQLPVSRDFDHEILSYLMHEFEKIRQCYGLPDSWPSEEVLRLLVDRTDGLWIYITTIVRFITDKNSFGPQDQLRIVLKFVQGVSAKAGADNPLAEMDFFYTLILREIPFQTPVMVRKILLIYSATEWSPKFVASTLNLSEEQFRHSCTPIQSVMELRGSNIGSMHFHFYHASFLHFMRDPGRSKDLCIYGDFLIGFRRECLDWLYQVLSRSTGHSDILLPSEPVLLEGWDRTQYYSDNLECFWKLCSVPDHPLDPQSALSLETFQFQVMLRLMGDNARYLDSKDLQHFRDNLPTELRKKIIQEDKCPSPGCTNTETVWILGHGENRTVVRRSNDGGLWLRNNQDPLPDWCSCGSKLMDLVPGEGF